MKTIHLKLMAALVLGLLIGASPCLASENGYCYIVGYSLAKKVVYFTPVLVEKVDGKSYSAEEFVADVELIDKMESAFQKYLQRVAMNATDFTVSARVAYKSQAIAQKRLDKERSNFKRREFTINTASDFNFKN